MRKAILDALKAKFQGVSESVLNRIADKLCKTVTTAEQVQTAVDGVTIQQVIEGYADSRVTEASQTAVHNYEQKYGLTSLQHYIITFSFFHFAISAFRPFAVVKTTPPKNEARSDAEEDYRSSSAPRKWLEKFFQRAKSDLCGKQKASMLSLF